MSSSTGSEHDSAGGSWVIRPLPGQVALDIEVNETRDEIENFDEWLAGNRWIVDNDPNTTDDEETQSNSVSKSKIAEE